MGKKSRSQETEGNRTAAKAASTGVRGQVPWFHHDWLFALLLVLVVFLTYQPMWWAGYIWDDNLVVTGNPVIVGPLGLKEIWTTNAADICPVTLTIFWLEHFLWGLAPLPYHLVNVLLHGACAVVLWLVLRSLQVPAAWLGAALWALHPVEVASVAWISEMKNTLSGLFYLLTILFFVRGLKMSDVDRGFNGGWNYALTLLFAALAITSKSSTVILPIVLCLAAWWVEGRWHWRYLAKTAPFFLMSLAGGLVSLSTQGSRGFDDSQGAQSWPQRLAIAGDAVWFYLGKLLWPHPLLMGYPRWQIDAGRWISYLPLLAAILVLVILWLNLKTWGRPCFFVFAYFLVALLPVLGLVHMSFSRYSFVSDHFQYLASMGPLTLVGAGIAQLGNFVAPKARWFSLTLPAGLLLLLGVMSWQQSWTYQNEKTLWNHVLAWNPDCWEGHNNLGYALLGENQVDQAAIEFQAALKSNPNFAEGHYNLGNALLQQGQVDAAINQYQKALNLNASYAEAHFKLGIALTQKDQVDAAVTQYQAALAINPNFAEAHTNLGNAFLQQGQLDQAIDEFQKGLAIQHDYLQAHENLGIAFAIKGRLGDAIVQFQEALRLKPDDNLAQQNLAKAQAALQQLHHTP